MLTITLMKNAIYFESLSDELYEKIKSKYPKLKLVPKGNYREYNYRIQGEPRELYLIIFELSYTYDIEIK